MSGQIQVTMITDRVKGDLRRYTERAAKKVLEARKITAINVQRVAKENAPVKFGVLRRSITTEQDGNDMLVGTNIEYAPYQEFGTGRMRPKPFLLPAAESEREAHTRRVGDAFKIV